LQILTVMPLGFSGDIFSNENHLFKNLNRIIYGKQKCTPAPTTRHKHLNRPSVHNNANMWSAKST